MTADPSGLPPASPMTVEEAWKTVVAQLKARQSPHAFATYVVAAHASFAHEDVLTLAYGSAFMVNIAQSAYAVVFTEALRAVAGRDIRVEFTEGVAPTVETPPPVPTEPRRVRSAPAPRKTTTRADDQSAEVPARKRGDLDAKLTFDTFVVGASNRLAHAVAVSVAEQKDEPAFNPLAFVGASGVGKTHLLIAAGNAFRAAHPEKRVVYVTSDGFMNELGQAFQQRQMQAFHLRYRACHLLLFDGIDLMSPKALAFQGELFNIIDVLRSQGRQIVVTSEKPLEELTHLQDRLHTRLQEGLAVKIGPPEEATCDGILRLRAAERKLVLPEDVLALLVKRGPAEARKLIGVLNRLVFLHTVGGETITSELCERELEGVIRRGGEHVTVPGLIEMCAAHFKVTPELVRSPVRRRPVVDARQTAMYFARTRLRLGASEIGTAFGGRDHSTVLHACEQIEKRMRENPAFRASIEALTKTIFDVRPSI